jgi:hypothetical protein
MKKAMVLILFVVLLPSLTIAQSIPKTGYELYRNLKGWDNPQTDIDRFNGMWAVGYMDGFLDSYKMAEDMHYEAILPKKNLSEPEREKLAKEINFHRLNLPKDGIAVGQFILVFKKYAEKNPGKLSGSSRVCLWESLVDEFGWK